MFDAPRIVTRLWRRNGASQWHGFLSLNGNRKAELTWGHLFTGTRDFAACNHLRSYKYYSDSIIYPDGFLGYACASYELFQSVSISQSFGMDPIENSGPYLCIWNSVYLCQLAPGECACKRSVRHPEVPQLVQVARGKAGKGSGSQGQPWLCAGVAALRHCCG